MDAFRLHLLMLILHAKARRDGFPVQFATMGKSDMTPKFRSVPTILARLHHSFDEQAQKFIDEAAIVEQGVKDAFAKGHSQLDSAKAAISDINKFVGDIDASNGPPLDGSQESSGQPNG